MKIQRIVVLCLTLFLFGVCTTSFGIESKSSRQQIEDWKDLKFGMFIHWGPVSISGKEIGWSRASETTDSLTHWKTYDQFYTQFNPTQFNADEWANLAKQAGMKYMIFTTKHHDGFTMWDSAWTNYDIMATPFKQDVVQELTDACKEHGILFGPYYSICDWYQYDYGYSHRAKPGFTLDRAPELENYITYMKHQLHELQNKYGPFLVFWFDGEWEKPWTHEHGLELYDYCKFLQPDALINNRVDKGRRGMEGMFKDGEFAGDYGTPEQEVGNFNNTTPWETCMTIGKQWAYKPNDPIKSFEECLRILIYTVGGDGNLLLNVSPTPEGIIPQNQQKPLLQLGDWLQKYDDGIYGTRGGPFKPGDWGASTHKNNTIYLFLYEKEVRLPLSKSIVNNIRAVSPHKINTSWDSVKLLIQLEKDQASLPAVIKIVLSKEASSVPVQEID